MTTEQQWYFSQSTQMERLDILYVRLRILFLLISLSRSLPVSLLLFLDEIENDSFEYQWHQCHPSVSPPFSVYFSFLLPSERLSHHCAEIIVCVPYLSVNWAVCHDKTVIFKRKFHPKYFFNEIATKIKILNSSSFRRKKNLTKAKVIW